MLTEGQVLFRSSEDIVQAMLEGLISRVPDAYIDQDGNTFLLFTIIGDTTSAVYLAVQITADDMFVQTASPDALTRKGAEFAVPIRQGLKSTGQLLFSGTGGTVIPINTEAAYDSGTGDTPLYFDTTESATIPSPGVATAPTLADGGAAGTLVAGTYEYAITFLTDQGETALGADSAPITIAGSHKVALSAIPLGGPGTTGRNIYRSKNGGSFLFVATIADVVTTAYLDNIIDASLGSAGPTISDAEQVLVDAESEDVGTKYNLLSNTITILTNAPDGVTTVVNPAGFVNGADEELTEDYRVRLLNAIRNPGTGSPTDLETWSEEIDGVGRATVFTNDNAGYNVLSANEASAETDASGWTNLSNTTLASSSTQAADGTKSLRMTAASAATMTMIMAASKTVTPGEAITGLAFFRAGTTARNVNAFIQWRDSGDSLLSTVAGTPVADTSTGFTEASVTAVAPAGAVKMRLGVQVTSPANAEIHYVDKTLVRHGVTTDWTAGGASESPAPGHVTIRISAPDGSVPGVSVVQLVQSELEGRDLANVSIHVTTFIPHSVDVSVTVVPATGYLLADVSASVISSITSYINGLAVGQTVVVAGIVQAVMSVIGVADVTVTVPSGNVTMAATEKPTTGTVTPS